MKYVCVYIYTYIHIHTHTYTYTHTYIHMHSHTPIYTHIHIYTYTYIKLFFPMFSQTNFCTPPNSLLSFTVCHLIYKIDWRYLLFKITHVPFYSPGPRFSHCEGPHLPGKSPHVSTLIFWNVSWVQFPDGKH